jgi:glutathione S-transferase
MRLYDYPPSGNGYKVRLLLALLARSYEYRPLDILAGETRTPQFLAMNPNGRIPLLELDDGTFLAESNAILYWLAQGTRLWPGTPLAQAQALQWMFFEQYSHEPNIATARFWITIKRLELTPTTEALLRQKQSLGDAALRVMEGHLMNRRFFVDDECSVADIALYAYTHVADEGGFDLGRYPAVLAWLGRVRSLPGYVGIDDWRAT